MWRGNIKDILELRSLISVPLRTSSKKLSEKDENQHKKKHDMETIWSPPYPDGKDCEDEKEKDEA